MADVSGRTRDAPRSLNLISGLVLAVVATLSWPVQVILTTRARQTSLPLDQHAIALPLFRLFGCLRAALLGHHFVFTGTGLFH